MSNDIYDDKDIPISIEGMIDKYNDMVFTLRQMKSINEHVLKQIDTTFEQKKAIFISEMYHKKEIEILGNEILIELRK